MRKFMHFAVVGFVALSLMACGKTSEEKAQARATDLSAQQHRLANELNAMGTPSARWSDADLNKYESDLNQLEDIQNQLSQLNGTNGIIISNNDNSAAIAQDRAALAYARAEKTTEVAREQARASVQATANNLIAQHKQLASDLQAMGTPSLNWSDDHIKTYEDKVNQLEKVDKQIESLGDSDDFTTFGAESRQLISEARSDIEEVNHLKSAQSEMKDIGKIQSEILAEGTPDTTWTVKLLQKRLELDNEIILKVDDMVSIFHRYSADDSSASDMVTYGSEYDAVTKSDISKVKKLLSQKEAST